MLVTVGDLEFTECPARFTDAESEQIVDLALADALGGVPPLERALLPSGLVEAVEFVRSILPSAQEPSDAG